MKEIADRLEFINIEILLEGKKKKKLPHKRQ